MPGLSCFFSIFQPTEKRNTLLGERHYVCLLPLPYRHAGRTDACPCRAKQLLATTARVVSFLTSEASPAKQCLDTSRLKTVVVHAVVVTRMWSDEVDGLRMRHRWTILWPSKSSIRESHCITKYPFDHRRRFSGAHTGRLANQQPTGRAGHIPFTAGMAGLF